MNQNSRDSEVKIFDHARKVRVLRRKLCTFGLQGVVGERPKYGGGRNELLVDCCQVCREHVTLRRRRRGVN